MKDGRLDYAEKHSPVWAELKKHLVERLAELRASNDEDRPADQTARLRGRIAEIKYILSLEQDQPAQVEPERDPFD